MVSRTMCPTRGTCTTINASEPGGTSLSWVTLAIVHFKDSCVRIFLQNP